MSYRIPTGHKHEPFMRAWRALFDTNRMGKEYKGSNFDELFVKNYNAKIIRTRRKDGLDDLQLEFEDEARFVLFMLEWS